MIGHARNCISNDLAQRLPRRGERPRLDARERRTPQGAHIIKTRGETRQKNDGEKRKVTSPTLGTGGKRLWLLRSRPDQVDRAAMRGGPSHRIIPRGHAMPEGVGSSRRFDMPSCASVFRPQIRPISTRQRIVK
ncbi:hypothetical protein BYI23_A015670 [Burkholderia sp. YI23]|nr:hypothetical protein BYI23_A015670 [Burkholderia sp. YI23]